MNNLENTDFPVHTNSNNNNKNFQTLIELKKISNIKICKTDKGGCLIIMTKENYETLIQRHLSDTSTYTSVSKEYTEEISRNLNNLISNYKEILQKDEINFLTNQGFQDSKFYVLPKIHKSKIINDYFQSLDSTYACLNSMPADLPSRPIVSNINSITSHLSYFIHKVLQPLVSLVPGYIKDSFHFIEQLPEHVLPNCLLVSLDVTSLYTIIPHSFGLEAIEYWIITKRNYLSHRFPTNFIIESLQFVLKNNSFKYNNEYYLQTTGTAMGTIMAPTYAHLVMAYLEVKLWDNCKSYFGDDVMKSIVKNYWRFIDDSFLIWYPNWGSVEEFLRIINNIHAAFNFTHKISTGENHFLDITIINNYGHIERDIYSKPTDSHQYLHFHSSHSNHIKRNIPYNLAYRISRIVSSPCARLKRLYELQNYLQQLKYPTKLITNAIQVACSRNNNNTPNNDTPKEVIPFVFSYTQEANTISSNNLIPRIRHAIDEIFPNNDINVFNSKRQSNKLLQLLRKPTHFKTCRCNLKKCKLCENIIERKVSICINNQEVYFNSNMKCTTANVIYCLFCKKCSKFYVGETGMQLNLRINLHRSQSSNPNYAILPVSKHLYTCGQGFNVIPIFNLSQHQSFIRRKMEDYFIRLLKPNLNA